MSKVKFTYFDFRARGELSRLVWAAAGKKYEEVTVQFPDWPKLKPGEYYTKVRTPHSASPRAITLPDNRLSQRFIGL